MVSRAVQQQLRAIEKARESGDERALNRAIAAADPDILVHTRQPIEDVQRKQQLEQTQLRIRAANARARRTRVVKAPPEPPPPPEPSTAVAIARPKYFYGGQPVTQPVYRRKVLEDKRKRDVWTGPTIDGVPKITKETPVGTQYKDITVGTIRQQQRRVTFPVSEQLVYSEKFGRTYYPTLGFRDVRYREGAQTELKAVLSRQQALQDTKVKKFTLAGATMRPYEPQDYLGVTSEKELRQLEERREAPKRAAVLQYAEKKLEQADIYLKKRAPALYPYTSFGVGFAGGVLGFVKTAAHPVKTAKEVYKLGKDIVKAPGKTIYSVGYGLGERITTKGLPFVAGEFYGFSKAAGTTIKIMGKSATAIKARTSKLFTPAPEIVEVGKSKVSRITRPGGTIDQAQYDALYKVGKKYYKVEGAGVGVAKAQTPTLQTSKINIGYKIQQIKYSKVKPKTTIKQPPAPTVVGEFLIKTKTRAVTRLPKADARFSTTTALTKATQEGVKKQTRYIDIIRSRRIGKLEPDVTGTIPETYRHLGFRFKPTGKKLLPSKLESALVAETIKTSEYGEVLATGEAIQLSAFKTKLLGVGGKALKKYSPKVTTKLKPTAIGLKRFQETLKHTTTPTGSQLLKKVKPVVSPRVGVIMQQNALTTLKDLQKTKAIIIPPKPTSQVTTGAVISKQLQLPPAPKPRLTEPSTRTISTKKPVIKSATAEVTRRAPKVTPRVKPTLSTRLLPITTPRITPKIKPITTPITTPRLTPITTPRTTPRLTPITTPRTTPRLTPITTPRLIPKPTPTPAPFVFIPEVPPPPVIFPRETPKRQRGLVQGYDVLIRRAGKFFVLSKKPLPRSAALSLGGRAVAESAAATFKIRAAKGELVPKTARDSYFARKLHFFRSKQEKGERVFIEKRRYRISTPGELKQITAKGLAAVKRRRKKKRLF